MKEAQTMFRTILIASLVAFALGATQALAQQVPETQAPQAGPGGMMGQGPGGMMGGQGGMMGCQGGMMGGQGGMMGGQGGMMGRDFDGMMGCPRLGGMMGRHGRKGDFAEMHSRPMMEARLAFIKADLEITEAQMPAWDAYAEAVRARHDSMTSMHEEMMKVKGGPALERMDARINAMQTMLDGLKALKGPTEALYAQLSAEQKEKADRLLGGHCGMM
jgi:hypothetical protein